MSSRNIARRRDSILAVALLCGIVALFLPLGRLGQWPLHLSPLLLWLAALGTMLLLFLCKLPPRYSAIICVAGSLLGAIGLHRLMADGAHGVGAPGLWLALIGHGFLVWRGLERISTALADRRGALSLAAAPLVFGLWLLFLWEMAVVGFDVPAVLLPAPSQIGDALVTASATLAADFVQTFIRAVIPGFVLGSAAGLLVGVLVDRVPFLQRGLLPIGNLVSALPIIGIAPIMVMWFGFDWQSKAAVVVIMTFFPMLVNTIAGLNALSRIERDLMATYAATYRQTLLRARLPAALPFIFNALKVNSTLALIGAIVAEFFGTPILGMGFRISTEVGRMNIPVVWATIAVAALAGSLSYGLIALAERWLTFWHPSFRRP